MDTRNQAALEAYLDAKLSRHLAEQDAAEAREEYLDNLECDLYSTGVIVGSELYCFIDAELDFYESETFDQWNQQMLTASQNDRPQLIAAFNDMRKHWVRDVYIPQLAEQIDKWVRQNGDLPGWEDVA